MNRLLLAAVVAAALTFIVVSATMNALFLSSLGRTALEAGLLAAVSLAGDVAKGALPIVLLRAVHLRAWAQAGAAAVMLAIVVALSLASGTGFAAVTRGTVTAEREARSGQLAARSRDLGEVQMRIAALAEARSSAEIEADRQAALIDRFWPASKSCSDPRGPAARAFCAGVLRLRGELATASERARLTTERDRLRTAIDALQAAGAGQEGDAQATTISRLLHVDRDLPRTVLTTALAVTLELGSVILVMLAAGPTLRGWREHGAEPAAPMAIVAAEIPMHADRAHWRRQRGKASLTSLERGPDDAR